MATDDQPAAGRFEGRAHLLAARVYYEDTDFTGFVYHANYLRFFERGRSDFLRACGVRHAALLAADTAFTVLAIEVRFHAPARIDDALLVRTTFDAVRGPRLLIAQSLLRGRAVLAEAKVEACCITLAGRAKRPPAALIEALRPYLADAASG
ncbi:MAG: YbgC/FadM family acyl-CoA thioesterase [Hyphomonadaceae bacterium]